MGNAQRWNVTYTKHVKQKRKVCHDGFLELQASHQKVVLYDEYDKLLASRFVKKEDVIKSGESLAFDSYLVDVGDECGCLNPVSTLTCQENGKNVTRKSVSSYSHKSENNKISVDRKPSFGRNKVQVINSSPSQNIIRDFKKREMNKYASSPSGLDLIKSTTVEWQVLYTSQVTQKAKKFHDGLLHLVVRGSQGRQVMLYDEYDKLLASRFVKKEDVIKSGESLAFDSYLVDIGDKLRCHKPVSTLTCQENGKSFAGESGSSYRHKSENTPICVDFKKREMNKHDSSPSFLDMTKSSKVEWQVLYTTQVMQKAKKFHDGFLQLVVCGSHGRQVMLYDTTKRLLESKFLKKNEIVSSGERLALDGYLVDIGEHEEDIKPVTDLNHPGRNYIVVGENDTANNQAKIPMNRDLVAGKTQKRTSPRKSTNLNGSISKNNEAKLNSRTPADEPRRAAHDIISILRKPMVQGKVVTTNGSLVEEHPGSYLSDVHPDVERHVNDNTQDCSGIAEYKLREKLVHDCSIKVLKSEAVEVLSDAVKCMVSEIPMPISSASIFMSNGSEEHENTREKSISKEITTETTAAVTIDMSLSKLSELCDNNKGSSSRCREGSSNEWTSCGSSDVEEKTLEHASHTKETDEFPSFDLGF